MSLARAHRLPRRAASLLLVGALGCLALVTGCKKDDMAEQPKAVTYGPAPVFVDGTEARPLPVGVISRAPTDSPGMPYAQQWSPGPDGAADMPQSDRIPFPVTPQVIDRGKERYNIYCAVCHGRLGDGNGMVVQRGFIRPPSYHNARLNDPRQTPDAHFYDVISNGYGAMFSYNDRVAPRDRWAITAYIRVLQQSVQRAAHDGRITPEQYRALQGERP